MTLIADDDALAACVAALGSPVGVDTEFIRMRTFHPVPALYQLAGDGGVALVDAQAPASLGPLQALLTDPERTKIMHSMSEDLEVVAVQFGIRPTNVVDTQLAHAFLSSERSASYAALVETYLGVTLDKQETRSDWLKRPLSPRQIAYAREDVAHLRPIWARQREALERQGRFVWFEWEMARALAAPSDAPELWYRNVKGAWRLTERETAVLRSLVAWREREARRRDVPRAWTVADEALLALARRTRADAVAVAEALPPRAAKRYAKALLRAHQEGLDDPSPPRQEPQPLGRRGQSVVKALRAAAQEAAARLGLATELLARRRELESLYRHYCEHGDLPAWLNGWRGQLVGERFLDILSVPP